MNKQEALEFKQKSEYHLKFFRENLHKSFEYDAEILKNYFKKNPEPNIREIEISITDEFEGSGFMLEVIFYKSNSSDSTDLTYSLYERIFNPEFLEELGLVNYKSYVYISVR